MTARLLNIFSNWKHYFAAVGTGHALLGLQAVVQIMLVPAYLGTIGKSAFGILALITAFSATCNISINALQGIMVRNLALNAALEDFVSTKKYFLATRVFLFVYFTLASIILASLAYTFHIFHSFNIPSQIDLKIVIAFAALNLLAQGILSAEYYMLSSIRQQALGHLYYIFSVLLFAALVLPWLHSGGNLEGVVAAQFFSTTMAALLAAIRRRKRLLRLSAPLALRDVIGTAGNFLRRDGRRYLAYGLVLAMLQADVILVGFLGGPDAAAEFTIVWKIAEVILLALWRFSDSLQPEILIMEAHGQYSAIRQTYVRGFPVMVVIALTVGVTYALASPAIVNLWVGRSAVSGPPYVFWAAGAGIFWLGIARHSTVFPFTLARLERLTRIALVELTLRGAIAISLFTTLGYAANLIAINVTHGLGVAWAYMVLTRRVTQVPRV
ncbi:MAG: lipopolysaccharide biosynthesis protein [Nitrospinota bacterium]